MQFGSSLLGYERPVDGGPCGIALGLVGIDGPLHRSGMGLRPLRHARVDTLNSISTIPSASTGQD